MFPAGHPQHQQLQQQQQAVKGGSRTAGAAWTALGSTSIAEGSTNGPGPSCARTAPVDLACRRGLRAPEALMAALRKRQYVQQLPYLVTGCSRPEQLLPPPVKRGRCQGADFEQEEQQLKKEGLWERWQQLQREREERYREAGRVGQYRREQEQQRVWSEEATAAVARAGAGDATALAVSAPVESGERDSSSSAAPASAPGSSGVGRGVGYPAGKVMSLAERFEAMRVSVSDRLAAGKSGIHGLGAFAKVPHRAGELVCVWYASLASAPGPKQLKMRCLCETTDDVG